MRGEGWLILAALIQAALLLLAGAVAGGAVISARSTRAGYAADTRATRAEVDRLDHDLAALRAWTEDLWVARQTTENDRDALRQANAEEPARCWPEPPPKARRRGMGGSGHR